MTDQNYQSLWKELLRNFQKKPGSLWVFLGLIGLGLVLIISSGEKTINISQYQNKNKFTNAERVESSAVSTQRQIEAELAKTLATITGVGEVQVKVNLKSDHRKVWERQSRINKRIIQEQGTVVNTEEDSSEELVMAKGLDGRDLPVLKEDLAPEIQGVIVVASGAGNANIKELLTNTIMTILDLPAHRVMVIPGEPVRREIK